MSEWVTIARILGSRGNKGEVSAASESDFPDRFDQLKSVSILKPNRIREELSLENTWWHGETLILKFVGVDSISQAQTLAGSEVQIPEKDRIPLPDGEFYLGDLVGLPMINAVSQQPIGDVKAWQQFGGPALLLVNDVETGEELMVPLVDEICTVDLPGKQILARLPGGLRGLNTSAGNKA
jgi:16S rRNA processing protein RimM